MNYDKTEMNTFVQSLYDAKMAEGKHGHYETMFHVVHKAIERATPAALPVGELTDEQIDAALRAARLINTTESRKDMRRAIEAAHKIGGQG